MVGTSVGKRGCVRATEEMSSHDKSGVERMHWDGEGEANEVKRKDQGRRGNGPITIAAAAAAAAAKRDTRE